MLYRVLERYAPSRLILPSAGAVVVLIFGLSSAVIFAVAVVVHEAALWLDRYPHDEPLSRRHDGGGSP